MTGAHSSSNTADVQNGRISLSDLQLAWLAELGLERRLLGPYRQASPQTRVSEGPASAVDAVQRGKPASPASGLPARGGLQPAAAHLKESGVATARPEVLPTDWSELGVHAAACESCGLHDQRDQSVFGAGDTSQPEWLVVGEAPGKVDDRSGLPFQGKAGKLLHAMLVAVGVHPASLALGGGPQAVPAWSRAATMYFTNLVKCRPLGNRSPEPDEVASCTPYLMQQIEMLQPRRILALGRLAAQSLLQVDADVDELRGRIHHLTIPSGLQIPVVVTWHPAALQMHPQNKGEAWADLNLAASLSS